MDQIQIRQQHVHHIIAADGSNYLYRCLHSPCLHGRSEGTAENRTGEKRPCAWCVLTCSDNKSAPSQIEKRKFHYRNDMMAERINCPFGFPLPLCSVRLRPLVHRGVEKHGRLLLGAIPLFVLFFRVPNIALHINYIIFTVCAYMNALPESSATYFARSQKVNICTALFISAVLASSTACGSSKKSESVARIAAHSRCSICNAEKPVSEILNNEFMWKL